MTTKQDDYNQLQIDKENFTGEHLTKLVTLWQDVHFLKADGLCGPKTLASIMGDEMIDIDEEDVTPPTTWGSFHGPLEEIPSNRQDVYRLFGNPADGSKADKKWVKENIRTFRKDHALPGVDPNRYVELHKLAEPYVREALRRAAEASDYKIARFGGFVFRFQRHDPSRPLSYHSWGIAFDVNPDDNFAKTFPKGEAPEPWSDAWNLIWPNGVPQPFVEAIKSVGFSWGGDWATFKDPMHFELVRR